MSCGLPLGELVLLLQVFLGLGLILARSDQLDDFVDLDEGEQAPHHDLAGAPARGRGGTAVRRRTVSTRNSPHSRRMSTMPLVSGRPSQAEPGQVERRSASRATCCTISAAISSSGSCARGARLDDQAQLRLAVALVAHRLDLVEDELLQPPLLLRDLLLARAGLGIGERLDLFHAPACTDTPCGSSVTTMRHWPRASCSFSHLRAATSEPRPVA